VGFLFVSCTALGIAALVGTGTTVNEARSPSPTPTSVLPTVTDTSPYPDGAQETTPSREPDSYTPKPSDFKLTPKILKKTCFGSAGCNITYRILVDYVGTGTLDSSKTYEVTYEVRRLDRRRPCGWTPRGWSSAGLGRGVAAGVCRRG